MKQVLSVVNVSTVTVYGSLSLRFHKSEYMLHKYTVHFQIVVLANGYIYQANLRRHIDKKTNNDGVIYGIYIPITNQCGYQMSGKC